MLKWIKKNEKKKCSPVCRTENRILRPVRSQLSHRCLWSPVPLPFIRIWDGGSAQMFPCGSRSGASVVFIYFVHRAESPRTSCLLATISHPAGPQVAKYTLFLFVRFAHSILVFSPPAKQISDIVMRGEWWSNEREGDIWPALFSLAESGSWRPWQNVWVLSECGGCHCSRPPPVSSPSDLPGGHAGKDKQQQGAPSFPDQRAQRGYHDGEVLQSQSFILDGQ